MSGFSEPERDSQTYSEMPPAIENLVREDGASGAPRAEPPAVVISVRGLSKCYPIYDKPRDRLKQFLLPRLQRYAGKAPGQYHREFWALRDVSFDICRGETVGIIGRNGAGKSTLLQIICGTLTPTAGVVETRGRIAALLELGAGFNPEFTGAENVFLNGALLGLSRDQVEARFDAIAAFADIGEFLEQPVKTYSSGMYVRLAFAVQACVDPEILVVDEALSVGDIGFQYKCFRRMEELRDRGVTILMVTHSTGSILQYADRCIVLDGGRVSHDTPQVLEAVLAYEKGMIAQQRLPESVVSRPWVESAMTSQELVARQATRRNSALEEVRFGSARAIIDELQVRCDNASGEPDRPVIQSGDEVVFRFRILSSERIADVVLGISLSKTMGGDIWGDNNLNAGVRIDLPAGVTEVDYRARLPISAGEYLIHCGLARFDNDSREELDQRRPMRKLTIWSPRSQVGVVHAPVNVNVRAGGAT